MASYESPTVIQQRIPTHDMTPLEYLLLSEIFTAAAEGDGIWFYAEQSTNDMPELDITELSAALAASEETESQANAFVQNALLNAGAQEVFLDLDMSILSWEYLFQDIVRRSATLEFITAMTAFTCSKMRIDGFGGMVLLITGKEARGKSLDDVLAEMLDEAERLGEIAKEAKQ